MIFPGDRRLFTGVELGWVAQAAYHCPKSPLIPKLVGCIPFLLAVGATAQHPRRTQLEIVAQLLGIASQGGATKTSLVYKANLNFKLAKKYLDELEGKGMIVRREAELRTTYVCTERGREALRNIGRTLDFMSDDGGFRRDALGHEP